MVDRIFKKIVVLALFAACSTSWAAGKVTNKIPTVSLTAPTTGASFLPNSSVMISAVAADADGTIAKVQFYQGTILLGTVTAAPFNFTWANVQNGSYTLTAKATDNAGAIGTSGAVGISVAGPKITNISPANGSTVSGENVVVSGTFIGDYMTAVWVESGNSTRQASVSGNNFSANLPIFLGQNTISISVARRDRTSDSASISITRVSSPVVAFTSPTETQIEAPGTITFGADAASPNGPISNVKFFQNSIPVATVLTAPYSFVWNAVPAGTYTLGALATDSSGYTATANRVIKVMAPNVLPTIAITSPTNGQVFTTPVNVALSSIPSDSDGSVKEVEYFVNSIAAGVTNVPPFSVMWQNETPGTYTLHARVVDNRGGVANAQPVTFTTAAPNQAPAVSIVGPVSGSTFPSSMPVPLSATASDSDGTVSKVEFFQGSTLLGVVTTAPYVLSWENPIPGNYTITAKATDNLGSVTTSTPVNLSVFADVATVTFTGPPANTDLTAPATVGLTATATPTIGASVARVEYFSNSVLIGTVTTAPFNYEWTNVAAGTYQVVAKVTDSRGMTASSAPVPVSITAPTLAATITAPGNGSTFVMPGPVTITVNAITYTSTIAKIELYDGATLVASYVPTGAFNSFDYNFNWTPSSVGVHLLTAKVTDAANVMVASTSTSVTINANNEPPPPPPPSPNAPVVEFKVAGSFFLAPGYIDLYVNAAGVGTATISKVELVSGANLIATLPGPIYNYTWRGVPVGTHQVQARVTDSLGVTTTTEPYSVVIGAAPSVAIAQGLDGSSVNDDSINIMGTLQAPPNSSVSVNGVLALVTSDSKFYANNVPLQLGNNALSISVNTIDGQTASTIINVTRTGQAAFSLSLPRANGISTLTASFSLRNPANVPLSRIDVSCIDGGPVSSSLATIAELDETTCEYSAPGLYIARISVYGVSSTLLFSRTQAVYVASVAEVARLVRGAFSGMLGRLKDGNISGAVRTITPSTQSQYNDIFTALGADLPVAAEQLGEISQVGVSDKIGEVIILRGEPGNKNAFIVHLILCEDGIWRVASM